MDQPIKAFQLVDLGLFYADTTSSYGFSYSLDFVCNDYFLFHPRNAIERFCIDAFRFREIY